MTDREEAEVKQCLRCALQRAQLLGADTSMINVEDFGRTEDEKKKFLSDLEKDENEVSKIIGKQPMSPSEAFKQHANKELGADVFHNPIIRTIKVQAPGNEDVMLTLQLPVPYPISEDWFKEIERIMGEFLNGTCHLLTFAPVIGTPNEVYFSKGPKKGGNGDHY